MTTESITNPTKPYLGQNQSIMDEVLSTTDWQTNGSGYAYSNASNQTLSALPNDDIVNWYFMALGLLPLLTLVGNIFVLYIICKSERLHSLFYYSLAALTTVNVLQAILETPLAIMQAMLDGFPLSSTLCKGWEVVGTFFTAASLCYLSLAILDGYRAMAKPLRHKLSDNAQTNITMILVILVAACILTAPFLGVSLVVVDEMVHYKGCGSVSVAHSLAGVMASYIVPTLIQGVLLGIILNIVHQQSINAKKMMHEKEDKSTPNGNSSPGGKGSLCRQFSITEVANSNSTVNGMDIDAECNSIDSLTMDKKPNETTPPCEYGVIYDPVIENKKNEKQSLDVPGVRCDGDSDTSDATESEEQHLVVEVHKPASSPMLNNCRKSSNSDALPNTATGNSAAPLNAREEGEPEGDPFKGTLPLPIPIICTKDADDENKQSQPKAEDTLKPDNNYNEKCADNIPQKVKNSKEDLNTPIDHEDIPVHFEDKALLVPDGQGMDNPCFDKESDTPLADAIQVKSDCNGQSNTSLLSCQTPSGDVSSVHSSSECLNDKSVSDPGHYSSDSNMSEDSTGGCKIPGQRRSILRREGGQRTSRKSVKFATPVSDDEKKPKKRNKKPVRRPTGPRKHMNKPPKAPTQNKNPKKKEKDTESINSNGSMSHYLNRSDSDTSSGHSEHSVASYEYMANMLHTQGLRLSYRVRQHQQNVHLICLLFVVHLILTLPQQAIWLVVSLCSSCRDSVGETVLLVLQWLSYLNPMIQPVLFAVANRPFCDSCKAVFTCGKS